MKTKKIKKMIASIAALAMCATLATPVATSFAATTVKINDSYTGTASTGNSVYKIFTVSKATDDDGDGYKYEVVKEWYPALKEAYTSIEKSDPTGWPDAYPSATADIQALNTKLSDWIVGLSLTEVRSLAVALADESTGKSVTTATWTDTTAGVETSLDNGYYLIYDSNSSAAPMLVTVEGTTPVEITLKHNKPSIEKKIKEGDNLVDSNTAGFNDTVDYQVKAVVPDTKDYKHYTYVITDTLSEGLDLKTTGTVTESTIYAGYKEVTESITVVLANSNTNTLRYNAYYNPTTRILKIVFNSLDMQKLGDLWGHQGDSIIVEYSATVNEDATVGTTGNANTVKLDYSNDPSASEEGYMGDNDHDGDVDTNEPEKPKDPDNPGQDDPDNPDKETPTTPGGPDDKDTTEETADDVTLTYTSEIEIDKVNAKNEALTGAEFTIVKLGADNKEENIAVVSVADSKKVTVTEGTAKATVGTDGKLKFSGLDEGTYRIYETKTPDGYNGLNGYIEFTLNCTLPTAVANGTETATWTLSRKDETTGVTEQSSGAFVFEVVNKKGSIFPTTGGIGTTLFYASGILMLVGAGIIVIVKRKAAES